MQLKSTSIAGLIEVQVTLHEDERGAFARTYDDEVFSHANLPTSWPQIEARPWVGAIKVERMRNSVDLPPPFGPSKPKISPCFVSKLTPESATRSP